MYIYGAQAVLFESKLVCYAFFKFALQCVVKVRAASAQSHPVTPREDSVIIVAKTATKGNAGTSMATDENQLLHVSSFRESNQEKPRMRRHSTRQAVPSKLMNREGQQPRIIQYNAQKSYPVMNTLLKHPKILDYAVICIQEPWLISRNAKQKHNPTQGNFDVFIVDRNERPFVAFSVNKNRIGSQDVKVPGRGLFHATIRILIQIEGREEEIEIVIHDVYNPNQKNGDLRDRDGRYEGITTNSTLPLLQSALEKHHGKLQLVVGDFNMRYSK